ncbi:hypothetical protein TL16_g11704 [Triparma laevis f. inornata]|uniref:Uncharacterized protein n=2 Tax=Triparma laevis TaxID=1534972 RepID=A0A9W7DTV0_9STRA|nr:hypothetical protein TrLO_g10980 [Triparma laevis f. longispina]GMH90228.1 hypothetical protein TL16_g11704 [Triparma laevis f. inornata]
MSSVGGGSSAAHNALFDKPKVRADPEDVRVALDKALLNFGSTLNDKLDLEKIEKEAAEEEKKRGEKFMNHRLRMHEIGEPESFGEEVNQDEEEEDVEMKRQASLSFAAEATGTLRPSLPDGKITGPPMRRSSTATSRRRSSGMSSFDDTAYNMFGGEHGHFSQQYMVSKWKKEARAQFEEAHGKRRTRFEDDGDGDSYDGGSHSEATTIEPGEVKHHTRMRLARIDGAKVIRHQLNIDGLYGGMEKNIMRNTEIMSEIMSNSEDRLESRKMLIKMAQEALELKKKMEAEQEIQREKEEKEKREQERSFGSSLAGIGDILKLDVKSFSPTAEDVRRRQREEESDESMSSASI